MSKKKIINIISFIMVGVCLYFLIILLNSTNPSESGPVVIMLVFFLLYLIFSSLLVMLFNVLLAFMNRLGRCPVGLTNKRVYYLSGVVAFAPIMLISLNTLNKLEFIEIILIFVLISLCCLYVLKRTIKQPSS